MTVFVQKALRCIFHGNALLLLAVHWALVYRVRFSIWPTAVNGSMECVVIDLLVRESGDLLRYSTSAADGNLTQNIPASVIHVDAITLRFHVSAGHVGKQSYGPGDLA